MNKHYILIEEYPHAEFNVYLTPKVYGYVRQIYRCNIGNESCIQSLKSMLNSIQGLLAYRTNAFNYSSSATQNKNTPMCIAMDDVKAYYRVDYDSIKDETFVSIYRINVNFENIGLNNPHKSIKPIQEKTYRVILKESQLHQIIREVIKRFLFTA